jgi:hypothetical protein
MRWVMPLGIFLATVIGLSPLFLHAELVTTSTSGKVPTSVVGSLPTCNAAAEGMIYGVTDALTPVALSAVTGGGAIHTLVYCNGTSWIVG